MEYKSLNNFTKRIFLADIVSNNTNRDLSP